MPGISISTAAGNSLLDMNSKVYRRVRGSSGKVFTVCKAKDLEPGDMVLYDNEYVEKHIDEIDGYLMQDDDRYAHAKEMIFERNDRGIYVPRLRTNLWRGAPETVKCSYPGFEDNVLLNTDDFDESDYRHMNRLIQMELRRDQEQGGPKPVTPQSSKRWLIDVMAPDDWTMFRALTNINPEFERFFDDYMTSITSDSNGFSDDNVFDCYNVLVGIRRGIMRYIARSRGEGKGGNGSSRSRGRLSLQQEVEIIMKYLMDLSLIHI